MELFFLLTVASYWNLLRTDYSSSIYITSNMMYIKSGIQMHSDWKVVYYEDEESRSEVIAFIERQKVNYQTKIFSWLSL
jgi:hypothetical protein